MLTTLYSGVALQAISLGKSLHLSVLALTCAYVRAATVAAASVATALVEAAVPALAAAVAVAPTTPRGRSV